MRNRPVAVKGQASQRPAPVESGDPGRGWRATIGDVLARIREICLSFPEVTERPSHGAPAFFVRGKTTFVQTWIAGHHDHTFPHLWCAAGPGVQSALIAARPERIFRPPYVGHRRWLGVRLDGRVDWDEVTELCEDAYRAVASRRLVALLDSGS